MFTGSTRRHFTRVVTLNCRNISTDGSTDQDTNDSESNSDHVDDKQSTFSEDTEEETRRNVLRASLPFVPKYGWTSKALNAGGEAVGLPPVAHGMFPGSGAELVHFFYDDCNQTLAEDLKQKVNDLEKRGEKVKITPFIREAIVTRLSMITPYIDQWPQAMGIMAFPPNAIQALTNLGQLMDDIWYHAGDKSTDFNWYTKRAMLAVVYKSTEIYMLQDKSGDLHDTWTFLDRRLGDLGTFGKTVRNIQQSGTILTESLYGLSLMTRNILGMNDRNR